MSSFRPRYRSLEDFLVSTVLTVDGQLDDGWGQAFPVKGREIDATVLFADITRFSARTADLDPTETLAFANHFFAWIAAEALHDSHGIVDKYIGDEVMIVFSREFGSADPFVEAVQAARWMAENDVHAFAPHIGIASGEVILGYVGTPLKYNCSAFGAPVARAARCASTIPKSEDRYSSFICFPAEEWADRDFDEVFPRREILDADGSTYAKPHGWEMLDPRIVGLRNLGAVELRHIVNRAFWGPTQSAEQRARDGVGYIAQAGRRWKPIKV